MVSSTYSPKRKLAAGSLSLSLTLPFAPIPTAGGRPITNASKNPLASSARDPIINAGWNARGGPITHPGEHRITNPGGDTLTNAN